MTTFDPTYDAVTDNQARALLGQVMGYVAATVAFAALGAYLGRDLDGATGLVLFLGAFAAIFGLNVAVAKGREQLAIGLLFGLGLLLGLATAPVIADYAEADPSALWQAAGATAAFVAALGAYGYATRRDLSSWARPLFWALLALIVFGLVAIFASIPAGNLIYAVAGLVIFGGFTIVDFNRLRPQHPRRRGPDRGRDLPRHLQRLPARPRPVRRAEGLNGADVMLMSDYLNHHLADETRAIELARRASSMNGGTRLGTFLEMLSWELEDDRESIVSLMGALGVRRRLRPVMSTGRLAHHGRPLEELEAIHLRINGKLDMWNALRASVGDRVAGVDFDELAHRAERQAEELERRRVDVAAESLS